MLDPPARPAGAGAERRTLLYVLYNKRRREAMKLEVKRIGNSTGLILPKELLGKLNLQQGQWLYVTEHPEGGVRLTPYDPDFEETMQLLDEVMDEYKDTLRTLAK
jgi:putative addiction module antidote